MYREDAYWELCGVGFDSVDVMLIDDVVNIQDVLRAVIMIDALKLIFKDEPKCSAPSFHVQMIHIIPHHSNF